MSAYIGELLNMKLLSTQIQLLKRAPVLTHSPNKLAIREKHRTTKTSSHCGGLKFDELSRYTQKSGAFYMVQYLGT